MDENLLKGGDVARILGVSRSFAYSLMQRGDIPTVRVGNAIRVRPDDLVRFIEQHYVENPKELKADGQES